MRAVRWNRCRDRGQQPGAATLFVGLLLGAAVPLPAQEAEVGANVQVSDRKPDRAHFEVRVASHPTNPDVLLGAGMAWSDSAGKYDVVAYRSEDGGQRWRSTLEVERGGSSMDPDVAFGPDGWAFLVEFGYGPDVDGAEELLHRSPDGGESWRSPLEIDVGDRPYVSVADAGTERSGRVYVHGADEVDPPDPRDERSAVRVVRIDEGGGEALGSTGLPADSGHRIVGNGTSAVLSDGSVVVLYPEWRRAAELSDYARGPDYPRVREPNARLVTRISTDGGETFGRGRPVAPWYNRWGRGRTATMPVLAADVSDGPFRDRLYAAWTDFRSGEGQILLAHSDDRGRTWSDPIVVNRGGGAAFHPMLAVNGDGVLGVAWYDRRHSSDGTGWATRFAASTDGGVTVGPSVRVSEGVYRFSWDRGLVLKPGDPSRGRTHRADALLHHFNEDGGDTAGMAADASGVFHPFWIDNRTGVPQIWTAPVRVDVRAVRHGDTALADLQDLSSRTVLRVDRIRYDGSPGVIEMEARLRNTSEHTISGPFLLRIVDLWSEFGNPRLVDARNGETGPGAVIEAAGEEARLAPGEALGPVEIRARLDSARFPEASEPPPPDRRAGAGYGALNLDLKALGRLPPY